MEPLASCVSDHLSYPFMDKVSLCGEALCFQNIFPSFSLCKHSQLKKPYFPCCKAEGFQSSALGLQPCSLSSRWYITKQVLSGYLRSFPHRQSTNPPIANKQMIFQTLQWLQTYSPGQQGLMMVEKSLEDIWILSLLLAWYGKITSYVMILSKEKDLDIAALKDVHCVLISGSHNLWQESCRYHFERVINLCYNMNKSLWILEHPPLKNALVASKAKGVSWQAYLKQLKNAPLSQMISRGSLGKAREICHIPR
ncbi:MAG: hypothetical protein OXC44_03380 [Proteobacteria bacterium]|nr:hypothetical protein [Pseudomonadota bacterium]